MEGPLEEANLVRADEIRPAGVATRTGIAAGIFGPKEPALIFLLSLGDLPEKTKNRCPSSFFYFGDPLNKIRLEPADAILSFFLRCDAQPLY